LDRLYDKYLVNVILIFFCFSVSNCTLPKFFRSGNLQVVSAEKDSPRIVLLGLINQRNQKSNLQYSDELRDFIEFELIKAGFQVIRIEEPFKFTPEKKKALSELPAFHYLIQGSISKNEYGTILESEISSHIFLTIYTSNGDLAGAIKFTVTGRDLGEVSFLSGVAERIIQEIKNKRIFKTETANP